jgi:hypothetical protein
VLRLTDKPGVVLVGHVVDRVIEIEVVVVHPVHRIAAITVCRERLRSTAADLRTARSFQHTREIPRQRSPAAAATTF